MIVPTLPTSVLLSAILHQISTKSVDILYLKGVFEATKFGEIDLELEKKSQLNISSFCASLWGNSSMCNQVNTYPSWSSTQHVILISLEF